MRFDPNSPKYMDSSTRASLPGEIQVNLFTYLRFFRSSYKQIPLLALGVAAALGSFGLSKWLGVVLTLAAAYPIYRFVKKWNQTFLYIQEKAWFGCLNPAKVVSVKPYRIAVHADLASSDTANSWPAIKIIMCRLDRAAGGPPPIGNRVPTVAFYKRGDSNMHWSDFTPLPVQYLTDDLMVKKRSLDRLDADKDDVWTALDRYLALVPTPYKSGLYEFGPVSLSSSPTNDVYQYLRTVDQSLFQTVACGTNRPSEEDVMAFEQEVGFPLPTDFRAFTMSQFGGLYFTVREVLWPKPKLYDVAPAWTFARSITVFGISKDVPSWLDIREEYRQLRSAGHGRFVPILAVSSSDRYCCDRSGHIVYWRHDTDEEPEPIPLTFSELLLRECRELEARLVRMVEQNGR